MKNSNQMKKQLLAFALMATFLKLLFIPQFASAQNTRIWATYYGGTGDEYLGNDDQSSKSVATDASGNVYLAANTSSAGLASGGFQDTLLGGGGPILVKFDASGNRLWATYYGDVNGAIVCKSVATDPAGNVYLAGLAVHTTALATAASFQYISGDAANAFLVKFDANGNRLWATYYGGAYGTGANSVATDAAGNVYLAGETGDTGMAYAGFQNTYGGRSLQNYAGDAFLVKFDANGHRLWATYYGGKGGEAGNGVATDLAGNVYLTGFTNDEGLASPGSFQDTLGIDTSGGNWGDNAFLVKFDANGNRLWATYYGIYPGYGGGGSSVGNSVATDAAGNVYIAGATHDTMGIASGGFQNTFGGGLDDGFLVKFDADGNRLWATYYGGRGEDQACNVATDAAGNVFIVGSTGSSDSIASGGFLNTCTTCGDTNNTRSLFLVKFDANGNRQCATYYGTIVVKTYCASLALDNAGNVYTGSFTDLSSGIASGGFQNIYGGGSL